MFISAYDAQDIAGTLSNYGSSSPLPRPRPLMRLSEGVTGTPTTGGKRSLSKNDQVAKKERALERLYAASPFSW